MIITSYYYYYLLVLVSIAVSQLSFQSNFLLFWKACKREVTSFACQTADKQLTGLTATSVVRRLFDQRLVARRDSLELELYVNFWLAAPLQLASFYRRNHSVMKFQFPRVSPGNQPLAKEPEDSGYEIAFTLKGAHIQNRERFLKQSL